MEIFKVFANFDIVQLYVSLVEKCAGIGGTVNLELNTIQSMFFWGGEKIENGKTVFYNFDINLLVQVHVGANKGRSKCIVGLIL